MKLRGIFAGMVVCLGAGLVTVGSASGQTAPTVTITPTSGPIGTTITATVTNCTGPNARLDFIIEGFTPANSATFSPGADGRATVSIQALEKVGQTENVTAARVAVTQCQGQTSGAGSSAPFTITRQQATTNTTLVTTTTIVGATPTTGAPQLATTTTTIRIASPATVATPTLAPNLALTG